MNSCRTLISRIGMMLALALALCAPSALRAQDTACRCDHYTLIVESGVRCNVTICERVSPATPPLCRVFTPGSRGTIPCPIDEVSIRLCDGTNYVLIGNPVIGTCTPVLQVAPACCVRVCRGVDPAGCPTLTVSAAPCASINCP